MHKILQKCHPRRVKNFCLVTTIFGPKILIFQKSKLLSKHQTLNFFGHWVQRPTQPYPRLWRLSQNIFIMAEEVEFQLSEMHLNEGYARVYRRNIGGLNTKILTSFLTK